MEFSTKDLRGLVGDRSAYVIINTFYKANVPHRQKMVFLDNGTRGLMNFYKFKDTIEFLETKSLNPKTNEARMRNLKVIKRLENAKRNEIQTLED